MPLILRITTQQKDYAFQVLTEKPSSQSDLMILMDENKLIFQRKGHDWVFKNSEQEPPEKILIDAIGKALALRFRINNRLRS